MNSYISFHVIYLYRVCICINLNTKNDTIIYEKKKKFQCNSVPKSFKGENVIFKTLKTKIVNK